MVVFDDEAGTLRDRELHVDEEGLTELRLQGVCFCLVSWGGGEEVVSVSKLRLSREEMR